MAITRAKKKLFVTNTYMRMLYGMTSRNLPSRFVKEIPEEFCECVGFVKHYTASPTVSKTKANTYSNSFGIGKPTQPTSADSVVYSVGQQVSHKTFGKGMIISVTPTGPDTMLEIAFENVGTKKIMANYAKLTF